MVLRYACERVVVAPTDLTCTCSVDNSPLDSDELGDLLDAASDALMKVTGIPVGRCTTIYRPCRKWCYAGCSCGCNIDGIRLPGLNPTVTAVWLDGVELPETEWTVISETSDDHYLVRTTPGKHWPYWQDPALAWTEVKTFAIVVEAGTYIDEPIIKAAVGEIACDILEHLNQERETQDGAVSANVYGLAIDYRRFSDPTDQETMTLAGLSWVRRFVVANGGANYAVVYSIDLENGWKLRTNLRDQLVAAP